MLQAHGKRGFGWAALAAAGFIGSGLLIGATPANADIVYNRQADYNATTPVAGSNTATGSNWSYEYVTSYPATTVHALADPNTTTWDIDTTWNSLNFNTTQSAYFAQVAGTETNQAVSMIATADLLTVTRQSNTALAGWSIAVFTAPTTGTYDITGGFTWDSDGDNSLSNEAFVKVGTVISGTKTVIFDSGDLSASGGAADTITFAGHSDIDLSAGDRIFWGMYGTRFNRPVNLQDDGINIVEKSAVPEPATLGLLGAGGLLMLARRRRRA